MRPNSTQLFIAITLAIAGIAFSQESNLRVSAPTIHNGIQQTTAVPLPPQNLSPDGQMLQRYPSNAAWIGTVQPADHSQVMATAASEPIAATRTPLAPPTAKSASRSEQSGGSTLKMLLSVGSSLLIVMGLFLGVAWFARKTMNTTLGGLPKQVVSILGRTPLAPRQQLLLVRFGSKLVLVSMIQGEARTLSEITDPLEVDQLAGLCESQQPGSITNSFRSILQQSGGGAV